LSDPAFELKKIARALQAAGGPDEGRRDDEPHWLDQMAHEISAAKGRAGREVFDRGLLRYDVNQVG